jgi:hypothetical protein
MMQGFGGPQGFVQAWKGCLEQDLARGGFLAMRHLEAVIRLVQHLEDARPDYSRMSDEELNEFAGRYWG